MKKGQQSTTQIFIYVLTILVVGFLLVYGYKSLSTLMEQSDRASYIKFEKELKNAFELIYSDYGSVKIKEFQVPSDFKEVCFVKNYPDFDANQNLYRNYPLIKDSIASGIKNNVFLIGEKDVKHIEVRKIYVNRALECVPAINGIIKLRLEGRGDHTIVSRIA